MKRATAADTKPTKITKTTAVFFVDFVNLVIFVAAAVGRFSARLIAGARSEVGADSLVGDAGKSVSPDRRVRNPQLSV